MISSRTPEGSPNDCPVCGNRVRIEPSYPQDDAPCPHCGHLLWFEKQEQATELTPREKVLQARESIDQVMELELEWR